MMRQSNLLTALSILLIVCLALPGCSEDDDEIMRTSFFKTIHVPDDAATIQAAIDRAEGGDTILVANGVYSGSGNRDIDVTGKILVIMSENGPDSTIINCSGTDEDHHYGFMYEQVGDKGSRLIGFTIRNAFSNEGAAVKLTASSPNIVNCVFVNNHATISGGAIKLKSASPLIENCTFVGNSCSSGSAIFSLAGSQPEIRKCLFAFNTGSDPLYSIEATSTFDLRCCNVYGNSPGDYVGDIASMENVADNISLDPLLCNQQTDQHLQPSSPCAPENSACGELIGALDVGCNEPL